MFDWRAAEVHKRLIVTEWWTVTAATALKGRGAPAVRDHPSLKKKKSVVCQVHTSAAVHLTLLYLARCLLVLPLSRGGALPARSPSRLDTL